MKMIGMSLRPARRFCRSRPLRSGRETSSTRQLGTEKRGRDRNASADANVSACQPSRRISASSASRTETSSSTTNTIGVGGATMTSGRLLGDNLSFVRRTPVKSRVERLAQGRIAERLEQACHGTLFHEAWKFRFIRMRRDKDDRDFMPPLHQLALEIGPAHTRHGDVEDQTARVADATGGEEFLRRGERLDRESELLEQEIGRASWRERVERTGG